MRVLCTLPNCAEAVTGKTGPKTFKAVDGGMLSEDLSDEDAKHFLAIKGYEEWKGEDPEAGKKLPVGKPNKDPEAGKKPEPAGKGKGNTDDGGKGGGANDGK